MTLENAIRNASFGDRVPVDKYNTLTFTTFMIREISRKKLVLTIDNMPVITFNNVIELLS